MRGVENSSKILGFLSCDATKSMISLLVYLVICSLKILLSFDRLGIGLVQGGNVHSFVFTSFVPCSIILMLK